MTTIVCLGDSITEGQGDSLRLGWVGRLNHFLQQNTPETYGVYNLGIGGDKLLGVYSRYFTEVLIRRPDVVLIAAGTNDCQRTGYEVPGALSMPLDHIALLWNKWLPSLLAAGHKIVVLGVVPPDDNRMPLVRPPKPKKWVMREDMLAYNEFLKDFCRTNQLSFVDLWPSWSEDLSSTHLIDGLHPNDEGYDLMFDIISRQLEELGII